MKGFSRWFATLRCITHAVAAEFRFNSPVLEGLARPSDEHTAGESQPSNPSSRQIPSDPGGNEREGSNQSSVATGTRRVGDTGWARGLPLFDEGRSALEAQLNHAYRRGAPPRPGCETKGERRPGIPAHGRDRD